MDSWWEWLFGRRHQPTRAERARVNAAVVAEIRQESAIVQAEARQRRRSIEAAVRELMATQAERGEEGDHVGFD